MTRAAWSAGLIVVGLAFALAAGAQDPHPGPAVAGPALDSATAAQVAAVVAEARGQGLPVDPIEAKVQLGAHRMPPTR